MTKDVEIWKNLRLIIVYTTDIYIPAKPSQSPFNVGLMVELPTFSQNQVEDLIQRYGLQLTVYELENLVSLTGGFSHLIQLSLYHSKRYDLLLEIVLKQSTTEQSIFNKTLDYLALRLQQDSRLIAGLKRVLESPTSLEAEVALKLKSLGLVYLSMGKAHISCELYQTYFTNYFSSSQNES